jgi:ferritin
MLISKGMNDLMNAQIGNEVSIASYFHEVGLPVLSEHYFKQSEEERAHALKFVRYILDADGSVAIPQVPAPRTGFKSAAEAAALALTWEQEVTKQINALLDKASSDRDYLAHDFLEWFAREQLEECSSADTLLKMIRRAGESGLMMVENAIAGGRALSVGGAPQGS